MFLHRDKRTWIAFILDFFVFFFGGGKLAVRAQGIGSHNRVDRLIANPLCGFKFGPMNRLIANSLCGFELGRMMDLLLEFAQA
jgi:hypothetical protein